jgi:signal transduction histidine kinase
MRMPGLIDRLRMRTTLLIPLLVLSFGWTVISLLIIRTIVQHQIRDNLASDLQHSVSTYQNLQHQRREMLRRESALLADLPSLKALMTAHDARTIEDAGIEFWQVSGSDFFALLSPDRKLVAEYRRGPPFEKADVEKKLRVSLERLEEPIPLTFDGPLYEVSSQPILFGPKGSGSLLGFVAVGFAIDKQVAQEVSEAAAAQVAFAADGRIVASTLQPSLQQELQSRAGRLLRSPMQNLDIQLGSEHYLAASVRLSASNGASDVADVVPQLIVLKSFDQASQFVHQVNQWVAGLGLLALFVGVGMVVSISRTVTHPLEVLVEGTRALGRGNFDYQLSEAGAEEVRELSRAFEHMRIELRRTQHELLDSERLATIGRMASSISHDLRHFLSAIYANAEFMSDSNIPPSEREELLLEVRSAVQGMTDLLDSLLLFTQTGRALHPDRESIFLLTQRSVNMVRLHPDARDVSITVDGGSSIEAWVDGKKLGRAIYNLVLNGCQAAKRGEGRATVTVTLDEDADTIRIAVADSGRGVPESIQKTMFLPFVSEGKTSGIGLGLTLAQHIAQEHGGQISLGKTPNGNTVFTLVLMKSALQTLGKTEEKKTIPAHFN